MKKILSLIITSSIFSGAYANGNENVIDYELIKKHCYLIAEAIKEGVITFEEVDIKKIKEDYYMLGEQCELRVTDYIKALDEAMTRGAKYGGAATAAAASSNYIKLLTKGAAIGIAPRLIPGIALTAAGMGVIAAISETLDILEEKQKKCLKEKDAEIIRLLDDHLKKLGHAR